MKKLNFNNIVKDKLTGHELGKLLIKDCITGIISGFNDKDIMEGNKPQEHILDTAEINKLIDGLTGTFDIQTYKDYREVWKFLSDISVMQMIYAYVIEIAFWKLTSAISHHETCPIEDDEIDGMIKAINKTNVNIKKFFLLEAIKKLIARCTQVYEILQTMTAFPEDLFLYTNLLIDKYNLCYRQADILPIVKMCPITEEKIHEVLGKINEVSTLYNVKKLEELLLSESKETCLVGGKEDEEY